MPKDKGKCQAQSMAHNLLFPHPIQLVSYRTHRIIFFPNRNMKICARKRIERGVGTFPEWGFRLCIIFYSWKFVNDRFRFDIFRTKRYIYLGRKPVAFWQGNVFYKFDSDSEISPKDQRDYNIIACKEITYFLS